MRLPPILCLFLVGLLSSCSVTRYYQTKKVRTNLQKSLGNMQKAQDQLEADYQMKSGILASMRTQGIELESPEYQGFQEKLQQMTYLRRSFNARAADVSTRAAELMRQLGGKKKIVSTDPLYKKLTKFETQSREDIQKANASYKEYQTLSTEFGSDFTRLGFHWVEVKKFSAQLEDVIQSLDQQCGQIESELSRVSPRVSTEKRPTFEAMKKDVSGLRGIRAELGSFSREFKKASAGKESYLVTPRHPQAPLFSSLREIQARAGALVTDFNQKAEKLK